MTKDKRGHFDPVATSIYLQRSAREIIDDQRETLAKFSQSRMLWNAASMEWNQHLFVHFCGLSDPAFWQAHASIVHMAEESLRLTLWAKRTDGVQQRHGSDHDEPRAWFYPHFVIDGSRWLAGEPRPERWVKDLFALETDVPLLTGLLSAEELLPLSAWDKIIEMQEFSDPGGNRREDTAGQRLALELAADPGQLHDPKSPVRKKARALMRRNMSRRWLGAAHVEGALNWLRTFEWREGESGLSPREVILRAYAYMPDVEPRPQVASEVKRLRTIPI